MKRLLSMALCAALGSLALGIAAEPALASDLCVGGKSGCFATIQAALDAAQDGDTIELAPGTYAGGITIDKSVSLVGMSAGATKIEGGGPVVTIGDGTADLTVSISRVTITGGFNDSKPVSPIGPGFFTAGGGVLIEEAADHTIGATVTISDSLVSGNTVTAGEPQPVCTHACSFANGGGIANWGTLTVANTRIADNVAGSTATSDSLPTETDASGGGIWNSSVGTLTLRHSFVTGNRSIVSAPNGRFAEGGAIGDYGTLTIDASVLGGNSADATSAVPSFLPFDIRQEAIGGAIFMGDDASAAIRDTTISGNSVSSTNFGGDAQATSGAIHDRGSLVLVDGRVEHNTVRASVPPESGYAASAVFGGIGVETAVATIRGSSITHNVIAALSASGTTNVGAGGIGSLSGHMTLERTLVTANRASASGVAGLLVGGGILNIDLGGGAPELALSDSVVTANQLAASPGITPQGGGVFSASVFTGDPIPFTLTRTVIAGNQPDQCVGC